MAAVWVGIVTVGALWVGTVTMTAVWVGTMTVLYRIVWEGTIPAQAGRGVIALVYNGWELSQQKLSVGTVTVGTVTMGTIIMTMSLW